MKKKIFIALTAFVFTSSVLAQSGSFIQYRVNKGDTVSKISRDYDIPVSEILKYNPDAKNGINENSFLLIPTKDFVEKEKNKGANPLLKNDEKTKNTSTSKGTHTVQPKETMYSISKKYNVSINDLHTWNPSLKETGLLADSEIIVAPNTKKSSSMDVTQYEQDKPKKIPATLPSSTADTIKDINNIYYRNIDVEPKATLYSLAVMYNTSVQRLLELNPELKDGLKSGQTIKVPAYGFQAKAKVVEVTPETPKENKFIRLIVEPQQTLYSISRKYDVPIKEIIKLNPDLQQGLKSGMELILPYKEGLDIVVEENMPKEENEGYLTVDTTGGYVDLSNSISRLDHKELALLLPFNIDKLGDNVDAKLSSDGFLNMTLDFYSGAKMAVEYAESLNLPLTVNVYDSSESKNSSGVKSLFNSKDFSNTDVIIGPFYQSNVDAAVKALPNDKVILVSPLSNEKATASNRLVQTMPYSNVLKNQLLEYFKQSGAKITVIVDDKKQSTKQFMNQYFPDIKMISTSQIGEIDKTLVKDKKNVFVLDSNSIASALLFTDKLKNKTKDYDIQIASFDKSDVFDYSEIRIETLVDLKYTFPSVTRDSRESRSESLFGQEYKNRYNVYPNRFATRGFDVTLDVIFRMFQKEGFIPTIGKKSQEIENRFSYSRNPEGTLRNSGVYLLQYDTDLNVKVLN
ncbi:LysM peptidoglycan-binding domain-containing protein [Myroides odoratimimus]|uniref:LysM peptidoglycan-binding domain-containing protein n=1 Tax=Myroides odoratimimus TaxID=76832 RepID=UPI002DBAB9CD|nr:LysM peptidoglycan-binding domain-containing protein [Myroides odoratimimus]MEC4051737.1 LysM peptidoglycan-binding domain-containing protein [Myroides odoratimimus]